MNCIWFCRTILWPKRCCIKGVKLSILFGVLKHVCYEGTDLWMDGQALLQRIKDASLHLKQGLIYSISCSQTHLWERLYALMRRHNGPMDRRMDQYRDRPSLVMTHGKDSTKIIGELYPSSSYLGEFHQSFLPKPGLRSRDANFRI